MGTEARLTIIFDDRCNECPHIRMPDHTTPTECPLIKYQRIADSNGQLHTEVLKAERCGYMEEISWAPEDAYSRTLVCSKALENGGTGGGYVTIVDNSV